MCFDNRSLFFLTSSAALTTTLDNDGDETVSAMLSTTSDNYYDETTSAALTTQSDNGYGKNDISRSIMSFYEHIYSIKLYF